MGIGSGSLLLVGLIVLLLSGLQSAAFADTGITSLTVQYSGDDDDEVRIEVTNIRGDLHGIFDEVEDSDLVFVLPVGSDSDFNGPRIIFTIFEDDDDEDRIDMAAGP